MGTWLKSVIQQTMVADASARPTSGQTRSNAVNTTPDPCFHSLQGMLIVTLLVPALPSVVGATSGQVTPFDASPFLIFPSRGPASVLSHGVERSPKKEGKEFVKFHDGLANIVGN